MNLKRPLIADLFCGAGGAAMGLYRAGFDVVGFDITQQPNYPFDFVLQDALTVSLGAFDAAWASPPCQAYTSMTNRHSSHQPALIPAVRLLICEADKPYIIENVVGAPLRNSIRLCGSFFNLNTYRHRLFESTMACFSTPCKHDGDKLAIYGPPDGRRLWTRKDNSELRAWKSIAEGKQAMGVHWMQTAHEIKEAIPPIYSEFLGRQLIMSMRHET